MKGALALVLRMMHAVSFSALPSSLYTLPSMHGGWHFPCGNMAAHGAEQNASMSDALLSFLCTASLVQH